MKKKIIGASFGAAAGIGLFCLLGAYRINKEATFASPEGLLFLQNLTLPIWGKPKVMTPELFIKFTKEIENMPAKAEKFKIAGMILLSIAAISLIAFFVAKIHDCAKTQPKSQLKNITQIQTDNQSSLNPGVS